MGLTDTSLSVLPIGKLGFVTGNATKEVGGTILNKTNQLYNDIGQKSYIYFQTTAKASILSGVKHNKETFGTIGSLYDDATLGVIQKTNNIAPNLTNKYILDTENSLKIIGGIEIANDIFNESSPIPSTVKGTIGSLLNNISNENEEKINTKYNYLNKKYEEIKKGILNEK